MKKIFFVIDILALLLTTSCTKKEDPSQGTTKVSVTINQKSEVSKLSWQEGDKVIINGIQSNPLAKASAGKAEASFEFATQVKSPFTAIFSPAGFVNSLVVVPINQSYVQSAADPSALVMLGLSNSASVSVSDACAFVKLTMLKAKNETLRRVTLASIDGTALSGKFTPDFTSTSLVYKEGGEDYVDVSSESGMAYDAKGKLAVYFAVPSGQYSQGFAVSAATTEGKVMKRKACGPASVTLTAGQVVELPEMTFVEDALPFSGGTGTEADPFKIAKVADLQTLADLCNAAASYSEYANKAYVQTADLDMNGVGFNPICGADKPFKGIYDGASHKISGLAPSQSTVGVAMFGSLFGAKIMNINFDGGNFSGKGLVAPLASKLVSSSAVGIKVANATISASEAGACGGVVAQAGDEGEIQSSAILEDCIVACAVKGVTKVGGIAGCAGNLATFRIKGCKSYGEIVASEEVAGGIIGNISANGLFIIDQCAAYGNVEAKHSLGGIAGELTPKTSDAKIIIANSIYAGEKLNATGNDASNTPRVMAGGLIGHWLHEAGAVQIINNASLVDNICYLSSYGGKSTSQPDIAGLIGLQEGTVDDNCYVKGCYSRIQPRGFIVDGDFKIANKAISTSATYNASSAQFTPYYGGVYGKCSTALTYADCYWDNCIWQGPGSLSKTSNFLRYGPLAALCANLQKFKSSYSDYTLVDWSLDERGYPTPGITSKSIYPQPLRIGVIGDSISTYRGWIPVGYAIYYYQNLPDPNGTGKISDVFDLDTYWNQLAYKLLPYGRIEKNIAWSGSCLTSIDGSAKPGFNERLALSGLGSPDIVLIHAGTNDYNRNVAGVKVDNTNGYGYEDEVPQEVMEALFKKANSELSTNYIQDAYVKLVTSIHAVHPNAKIVIVIGDRPTVPMENGMLKIADHYDYVKAVDFRAAGYNNLPKFSGSHPTKAGHKTMADKIYKEVGQWLREGTQGAGYGNPGEVTGDSNNTVVSIF